jgi:single-stranded-DNA-specific exonuclease
MQNQEPVFVAHNVRVTAPVRNFKERHVQIRLAQGTPATGASFSALGWDWAERIRASGIQEGSILSVAYKLRENEHPQFGGLELEIADVAVGSGDTLGG